MTTQYVGRFDTQKNAVRVLQTVVSPFAGKVHTASGDKKKWRGVYAKHKI